ncbi:MAG: lysine--tRNA ligase [Bdellovibrionales bacterium]|nr:lysine--tRNA ligase [Bdellovibrionales bacterium]
MSETPDYHSNDEFVTRSAKLREIQELGVCPYPHKYEPSHVAAQLLHTYGEKDPGDFEAAKAGTSPAVQIAGRLVLFRAMGKNAFGHVQDHTGRVQLMFNRDISHVAGYDPAQAKVSQPPSHMKFIEKRLDLGDYLGVKGHVFRTHTGELTVLANEVKLLSKALLPLPDKHAGLADKETRYRKRWLDLISNPEVAATFRLRSKILGIVRDYFDAHNFVEVETPVLQTQYGGANARPFLTHLNALDQDMFLRISLELPLKKLIVGGMNRVYEIGRVFRNEGVDRTHNPEFTLVESYAAYWDYNDVMSFTEKLFEKIALELYGKTSVPYLVDGKEVQIELKTPWKRLSMKEAIKAYGGTDVDALSEEALRQLVVEKTDTEKELAVTMTRGSLIAALFETVEGNLIQPHHIIDHPIETTPLCKPHRDPKLAAEGLVERFESFIVGKEFSNAYSELNDPVLQRKLLEGQADKLSKGDAEAHPMDEEFMESICQGLPPTGGLGIGIDRLVMLFTNQHSIRDVLFFPLMRRE